MDADLQKRIAELVPKVAADYSAQSTAMTERDQAEAELLARVVELIRPALSAVCGKLASGQKGFLLIEGKPETAVYEDGKLDEEPAYLVRNHSLVRMLETIVKRLEQQGGREKAARQAEHRTAKVRAILELLSG